MNINATLHSRWANDATLNGLLPVAKVVTGIYFASEPAYPYATITRPGDRPLAYSSEGAAVERVLVRITVYHGLNNYDEGLAIADAVKAAFDRKDFALSGSDKVLNMQRCGYMEVSDEDVAGWFFVLDFDCSVYLAAGV